MVDKSQSCTPTSPPSAFLVSSEIRSPPSSPPSSPDPNDAVLECPISESSTPKESCTVRSSDPDISPQAPVYTEHRRGEIGPTYMLHGLIVPDALNIPDITAISSAYATETCQRLHAEAFIAERRYRQHLLMSQAYKLRMLQAQDRARQASKDVIWFQNYAGETRAGRGYNPDWHVPPGILDSARPFPGVPYNPDSAILTDQVLRPSVATPFTPHEVPS